MSTRSSSALLFRRLILVAALVAAAALVTAPLYAQTCTPVNTCTDPRGCPDFLVEPIILKSSLNLETQTYDAADCSVVEGEVPAGTNRFITFSTTIVNFGPGALVLGNPQDHPEWFDLTTCHGHTHIKEYADYRLWTAAGYDRWAAFRAADPDACADDILAAHPDLAGDLIEGGKRGFCLYDVVSLEQLASFNPNLMLLTCPHPPDPQTFLSCDYSGLSVCWTDIYESIPGEIDGQRIAITGLPDGDYVIENEANARHFFMEGNYRNNTAAVKFRLWHNRILFPMPRR